MLVLPRGSHSVIRFVVFIAGVSPGALSLAVERYVPSEYPTVQSAIDASSNGDAVVISPGTYTGDGNRDIDFKGKAITVRGTNPDDRAVVAATVIDCQGTQAQPHRGFTFHSGEGPGSTVSGLTIAHGYAGTGGGMYCHGAGPTVSKCAITSNLADTAGGGIACVHSDIVLTNCFVVGNALVNSAIAGGAGVSCSDVKVDASLACTGGGMPVLRNCVIAANSAGAGEQSQGGGIGCWNVGEVSITNCTITGNSARVGGGLSFGWCARANVTGSIVMGNISDTGQDMAVTCPPQWEGARVTIAYSAIPGALPAGTTWTCGVSAVVWGDGNIGADPRFRNAAAGDYQLGRDSPCVNAANPAGDYTGQTDLDGHSRVSYGRADMGAYEYTWSGSNDFDADHDVDLADFGFFQACFNGPNRAPARADCSAADLDGDLDVDLNDFMAFQACFNGSGRSPSCR